MGSKSMPKLALPLAASGKSMPVIGLGTFPSAGSEATKEAILNAIRAGYTHFDTAAAYNTEQFLGEAISEALSLGLINSRDDLFITSKLWCSDAHPHLVLPAIHNSLRLKKNPHGEPADLLKMSVKSKWVHLKLFDGDRAMPHFFEFVLLLGSLLIALMLHCYADCSSATTKTRISLTL